MCPAVLEPGEFFVCTADIPRGSDVVFKLEMVDDLDSSITTSSGWIPAPQLWLFIPGGPLKTFSWNKTTPGLHDQPAPLNNYIIQATRFQYLANLSAIEYVPATTGKLYIDVSSAQNDKNISKTMLSKVLSPRCPAMLDPATLKLVPTGWCPLTGSCEKTCYSSLQSQADWWALQFRGLS